MKESRPQSEHRGFRAGASLALVAILMMLPACSSGESSTAASTGSISRGQTSPSSTSEQVLGVTSTLDGRTTLPHRIHWEATPSVAEADVSEVLFLIDGNPAWVEHNAPYFYGDDGNYLVTSFLSQGEHSFTVRVLGVGGQSAESNVNATVAAAPSPPDALTGMSWSRTMTPADKKKATSSEPPPTGLWGLTIDPVGWMLSDPEGGGLLFDVAYQNGHRVQLRASIERPPYPSPTGGGFCEEPDAPFAWSYSVDEGGKTLTLHPIGQDPCGDRVAILEGTWANEGA